ncbi:UDP-N-acetylglucosamine 4,6-dehydratase (inverting) [Candidatus Terasakiella magnetica]|uniref:UDP-N-acetylglucosamine 4,6-dehydratase (Inverting) n=1 Tax=Candidatus Terasakiella magnetica TaxID=1867952 RepID=A0A1C3RKR8_9PROT|nr:UDP-N-acetylglucosamine 4,6-dehydratase (inverting) [Candidatus Terasakiella magnetica]SCA57867.1 UDP-N-acetylglucosamine 4,6-dehydratase (inverting) [Candidatus Terasakiella magnetica]
MWLSNYYDLNVNLDGKSILVTGGTGSFGKRFVKTVLERYKLKRLVIFSRDELKQFEMQQQFSTTEYPCMRYFIGDVRDETRLEMAMKDIDIVIHAAALKHVPVAEYNPTECIRTNVNGAENVVRAALANDVKHVLALSTDKAVNPINLYGASKLAADKIFVAANNLSGTDGTVFSVVRYGNVVGSRGSVLPFFKKLVAEGTDHLPITDPDMTRFWITLQQGVDFVISNLRYMRGGEIFVPKMPSMKITEMATYIAPELPQKVIGIRPGEKLHEMMVSEDDAPYTDDLGDRYVVKPAFSFWSEREAGSKEIAQIYNDAVAAQKGFRYASNINDDWLDNDRLDLLLKEPAT